MADNFLTGSDVGGLILQAAQGIVANVQRQQQLQLQTKESELSLQAQKEAMEAKATRREEEAALKEIQLQKGQLDVLLKSQEAGLLPKPEKPPPEPTMGEARRLRDQVVGTARDLRAQAALQSLPPDQRPSIPFFRSDETDKVVQRINGTLQAVSAGAFSSDPAVVANANAETARLQRDLQNTIKWAQTLPSLQTAPPSSEELQAAVRSLGVDETIAQKVLAVPITSARLRAEAFPNALPTAVDGAIAAVRPHLEPGATSPPDLRQLTVLFKTNVLDETGRPNPDRLAAFLQVLSDSLGDPDTASQLTTQIGRGLGLIR